MSKPTTFDALISNPFIKTNEPLNDGNIKAALYFLGTAAIDTAELGN